MDERKPEKFDPIRGLYFRPLEIAETFSIILFFAAGVLSLLVVVVEKGVHPRIYECAQAVFLLITILFFGINLTIRLYWSPRAQSRRFLDFLSSAFHVNLTHERTTAYYNNEAKAPPKRIALQLLENCFFTKDTLLRMCRNERVQLSGYVLLWLLAILNRDTSIDIIVIVSQTLFSEQLVSRFFRIEWFRAKVENLYQHTYQLVQAQGDPTAFEALVLCNLTSYENAKANAGVTLSSRIFDRNNERLTAEWESIKRDLKPGLEKLQI